MLSEKRNYFYNKLVFHTDRYINYEDNKKLLLSVVESIDEECVVKFFSELVNFIEKVDGYGNFEELYEFTKKNHDYALVNEVINTGISINKRATLFLEYKNIRDYGFLFNSKDELECIIILIEHFLDLGATKEEIDMFIDLPNTPFKKYKKEIDEYVMDKFYIDQTNIKKNIQLVMAKKNVK